MNKPSREVEEAEIIFRLIIAGNFISPVEGELILKAYRSQTARIAELEGWIEAKDAAIAAQARLLVELREKYASANNDAKILGAKLELSEHRESEMHKMALRMKGDLVEVERDLAACQENNKKLVATLRIIKDANYDCLAPSVCVKENRLCIPCIVGDALAANPIENLEDK